MAGMQATPRMPSLDETVDVTSEIDALRTPPADT